ncbi:hypothetical protein CNECB9_1210012 [Cupriavidus necator]|uniref:Uncharacterized protein n=1 Tax=Cupriavidus necator TaxID=106590 RepID=A0A1K0I9U3_CUPNE|nr:hypothetical protein CNECB9_1210012 [Cupriavidus necator]
MTPSSHAAHEKRLTLRMEYDEAAGGLSTVFMLRLHNFCAAP